MQATKDGYIVLDIGGTLTKLCFVTSNKECTIPHKAQLTIHLQEISLYFGYFKTIQQCWQFLNTNFIQNDQYSTLIVTGGGAFKFDKQLKQIAQNKNMSIKIVQQFQSLVGGLSFFKREQNFQQFVVSILSKDTKHIVKVKNPYKQLNTPLLVVNVGSGVSILNITQNEKGELNAQRVGGTSLGGGFFMGLANLLVGENNFYKLVEMAEQGDVKHTDIIPSDFPELSQEFSQATVLVSLGKLDENSKKQDIVRSLFFMVTFNLAQIALAHSEILKVDNVLFTGFYCRNNSFFMQCFSQAFSFYNKKASNKRVYSMLHDGFLGTLGALACQLYPKKQ